MLQLEGISSLGLNSFLITKLKLVGEEITDGKSCQNAPEKNATIFNGDMPNENDGTEKSRFSVPYFLDQMEIFNWRLHQVVRVVSDKLTQTTYTQRLLDGAFCKKTPDVLIQ